MIGNKSGTNWVDIWPGLLLAFVFGLFFSYLVRWLRKKGSEYRSSFLVVIGVTVTILVAVLMKVIELDTALILLLFFGSSGLPMIAEEWMYALKLIEEERRQIEAEIKE
ncbi:MAG: hypothetical protein JEZ06_00310 [Anaerolineaceae bacterium]|nr:hypothetical protein [Anaerolineaceae bacterium]